MEKRRGRPPHPHLTALLTVLPRLRASAGVVVVKVPLLADVDGFVAARAGGLTGLVDLMGPVPYRARRKPHSV